MHGLEQRGRYHPMLLLYVLIATLGALPSSSQLTSVAVFSSPRMTSETAVTWSNPLLSPTTPPQFQTSVPLTTPDSQNGLVLSPAAPPFPQKLVDKTREGKYVDMKEFLVDNMALVSQLEAVPGMPHMSSMLGSARPRLREVTSISTWCYCFLGYMAIRTRDPATRDQLAYARLLIGEARRHGGMGWVDYDRAFRQQLAADPSLPWNTLIPGLQASTLLNQRTGQGMFCTLCRGVDHTQTRCALYCLQPPTTTTARVNRDTYTRPGGTRRREVCISWNRGSCIFPPGQCFYSHECPTCLVTTHRARDCSKTPDNSKFKSRLAPRPLTNPAPTGP